MLELNDSFTLDRRPGQRLIGPQQRIFRLTTGLRAAALAVFVAIGGAWTVLNGMSPRIVVVPLGAYLLVSLLGLAFRQRKTVQRLAALYPFADIAVALAIHLQGLRADAPYASAWSVSSLCAYVLILALAGLSSSVRLMSVLTPLGVGAEVLLLHTAGLSLWPILVAIVALGFVALATNAVPRAAAAALRQEEQAAAAKRSLAQLQEQHQRLELLQREKDALLETIVHDMRSPVGAALLSVEYLAIELKKEGKSAAQIEATDDALATLNSLSRMISQILDMSKLESGRLTLRFELRALRQVLDDAIAEILPRARTRSISIDIQAPENLTANLDMRIFPRALDALLAHSIRYTPERGRVLVVASQGTNETRVSIHSTAPALPDDERKGLFERFSLRNTEPRRSPSWGIGLYFCRLVAEAHQGTIAIEDVTGWPTSMVLHLPPAE